MIVPFIILVSLADQTLRFFPGMIKVGVDETRAISAKMTKIKESGVTLKLTKNGQQGI